MAKIYGMRREWLDHPVFGTTPFCMHSAWSWLVAHALTQDRRGRIRGKVVQLRRGQLSCSTRRLARYWRWSEPKVRRFLKRLEAAGLIDATADIGQMVVTIRGYDEMQIAPPERRPPATQYMSLTTLRK
jgi:hypothetical protein